MTLVFGDLPEDEQVTLFRAWLRNVEIEFKWPYETIYRPAIKGCWYKDGCYRIKAIPDSIPWEHIAPEYKWAARDEDGDCYVFENKPECGQHLWIDNSTSERELSIFAAYKPGTTPWKDSLQERSKEK